MSDEEAVQQAAALTGWEVQHEPHRISKSWVVKNFMAGMRFFEQVAELAEEEGHHPDIHLSGYRNVRIDIWTHAINGLSVNDFILAARIDQLPIELKSN
jgi:4a-hydroxytetrahydrobiopterin dehydratase